MPPSPDSPSPTDALRAEVAPMLAERCRAGMWLGAIAVLLYAFGDLVGHRDVLLVLWSVAAGQIAALGVAYLLLRGTPSWRRTVATAVGTLTVLYGGGVFSDWLSANQLGTALSAVGVTVATAALFPWGAGPQAMVAGLAALAVIGSATLVHGRYVDLAQLGTLIATLLGGSVLVAGAGERVRRQRAVAEAAMRASSRRAESEARIASVLARASEVLAAHLDEPDMLDRLHGIARETLGVDWSSTLILDQRTGALCLAATSGVPAELREEIAGFEMPVAALPDVAWDGVFEMPDADAQTRLPRDILHNLQAASFVGAPLSCRGHLLGVQVHGYRERTGAFSPEDRRLVAGLAHATALAIENAQRIAGLEAASRLKTEFVACMSHELRTPLNVITGYTEMLAEDALGPLTQTQRETLGRIRRSADELLELVNATLDVGRLEAGRVPVEREPVDLGTLLNELDIEVRPLVAQGVALRWEDGAIGSSVLADRGKLKTIVKNLVGNACKFTRQGSIEVSAGWHGGVLTLTVRDSGIGIAAEQLPHIFDMFRQGDGSTTRKFGGVGLGLHIVRRLVDLLGGAIEVESTPAIGSTFVVRLPAPMALRVVEGGRRSTAG